MNAPQGMDRYQKEVIQVRKYKKLYKNSVYLYDKSTKDALISLNKMKKSLWRVNNTFNVTFNVKCF